MKRSKFARIATAGVVLAVLVVWELGAIPLRPSANEQRTFEAMLQHAPSSFTASATLEHVELVRKNMNPMPGNPLRWLLQQPTYEYAATYHFAGTDTRFVVLLPVNMKVDELSYYDPNLTPELLSVVNAYSKETSAPLVSFLDDPDGPPAGAQPDGTVWLLYSFDPTAVDSYLGGKGYRFLRSAEGSVSVLH